MFKSAANDDRAVGFFYDINKDGVAYSGSGADMWFKANESFDQFLSEHIPKLQTIHRAYTTYTAERNNLVEKIRGLTQKPHNMTFVSPIIFHTS